MRIDPYKHEERYLKWKEKVRKGIPDVDPENSEIILKFIEDMEYGINISKDNIKGARSFIRLNTLKEKMCFFARSFKERFNIVPLTNITEVQLCKFFSEMSSGVIKRKDGKSYQSVRDYVKIFKSFWHWYQRSSKKEGKEIPEITDILDTRGNKPKWVYLTEEQVRQLTETVKFEYKVLITFLMDTGIRAPTELVNVKVSDLYNDFAELNIREEASKTFGRRIKLMICSDLLREYIKNNNLQSEDYIFPIKPYTVNKYLQRIAQKVLGEGVSPAGQKYSELTMYDFRHISCCYWLPRYKSESALKFRFGWKKSDKIHYYSELLGMKDTICEEDMLVDITKTEIEKRLLKSENEKEIIKERMQILEEQIRTINELVKKGGLIIGDEINQ